MRWLREWQTKRGLELSIGPYVTPRRRYIVYYFIYLIFSVVFLISFFFLWEVFLDTDRAYRFFNRFKFVKFEWVVWMVENPLQVFLGALGIIFLLSRLTVISGRLAFLFLSKYSKVIFTPDKIKVRRFFFFWLSCSHSGKISLEMKQHPKAREGEISAQRRGDSLPLDNTYARTGIVIMRCGARRPIKIATIYDWVDFGLGHKAEQLLITLQKLANETAERYEEGKRDSQDFYENDINLD